MFSGLLALTLLKCLKLVEVKPKDPTADIKDEEKAETAKNATPLTELPESSVSIEQTPGEEAVKKEHTPHCVKFFYPDVSV